ncbi:MAG: hypothetical protein ACLPJH_13085 [Myxococcaceae bacterium]
MGALGLCLVLLTLGADPSEDLEGAAPKGQAEEQFLINVGAKLESLLGTELIGSVDQYSVTENFVLEPGIFIQQRSHTGQVTVSYVPWLLYTPSAPDQKLLFNRVLVEVEQQLSHTVGIYLVGRLWVGNQTFSPVVNLGTPPTGGAGQGPPNINTIPQVPQSATLDLLDTSARFGFYVLTSAVFRLDLDVGYVYSEGLNDLAKQELPLQRGPFLDVVGTLKLQTHDALVTTVRSGLLVYGPVYRPGGSNNENGSTVLLPHYNIGLSILGTEAGLKWQHSLSANVSTELGGGIGVVYQSSSYDIPSLVDQDLLWLHRTPVPAITTAYPIFGASIRDQVPLVAQTLLLSANIAVLPIVNQFSGTVIQRLDISASALWGVGNNWLFEASAGAAASANPREIDARAELRAVFQAGPHVVLAGGARIAYLNYAIPGALNGTSWVLFLSVAGASGKLGAAAGASTSQGDLGFLQ